VGEVHIDPTLLIPNARRGGFEDTDAWTNLKKELYSDLCAGLAQKAYKRICRDKEGSAKNGLM